LCGVTGRIHEVTLKDLRSRKPDVPTLREVLRAVRNKARLLIEMKRVDARLVAAEVDRMRMADQVIVFSFSVEQMHVISKANPDIPRFGLIARDLRARLRELRSCCTIQGVGLGGHLITSGSLVDRLHRQGLQVLVWTVNRASRMKQLARWGVDGIITNHPDRLLACLDQRRLGLYV
jgi:glycerophosphoryl diester phosphodiesterase